MAVVAGVVFFAVRGLLALVPYFALRFPIKKCETAVDGVALFAVLLPNCYRNSAGRKDFPPVGNGTVAHLGVFSRYHQLRHCP
jgi:hypothetical protein